MVSTVTKYRIILRILRRPFKYWYPGANFINEIIDRYGNHIENGDILVISEKALSIALGNIYDEEIIHVDIITKLFTFMTVKILWTKLLRSLLKSQDILSILDNTSIKVLGAHKKLALRYGGLKHFLKPVSEAGIDTTNLPYSYVSLPLLNIDHVLNKIQIEIYRNLKKYVNILVIDTDKTYRMKYLKNVVFATRFSTIKGVIDLGFVSYILGKKFRNLFVAYPTPIAYKGIRLSLHLILYIAKFVEKFMGHGLGRTAVEMLMNLNKRDFKDIKWIDMNKVKHYPVILVKLKIIHKSFN
ncbi:MAG: coenzyme F420-0:L-glutamate ligase [Ignisphaera sp.]|uniref:Coenzyme F420:L-glutamate ligase-like domain-containing protein n=1 Tax=Ignisphaera aggregans TaxID=334771 RepID=A0A7J3N0R3_9CREN